MNFRYWPLFFIRWSAAFPSVLYSSLWTNISTLLYTFSVPMWCWFNGASETNISDSKKCPNTIMAIFIKLCWIESWYCTSNRQPIGGTYSHNFKNFVEGRHGTIGRIGWFHGEWPNILSWICHIFNIFPCITNLGRTSRKNKQAVEKWVGAPQNWGEG